MFEYLSEIFTKPELQRSWVDNAVMTIILGIAVILIFIFVCWVITIYQDIQEKREKKKLEKDKER